MDKAILFRPRQTKKNTATSMLLAHTVSGINNQINPFCWELQVVPRGVAIFGQGLWGQL